MSKLYQEYSRLLTYTLVRKEVLFWLLIRFVNLLPLVLVAEKYMNTNSGELKDLNLTFIASIGLFGFNTLFQHDKWSGYIRLAIVFQLFIMYIPVASGLRWYLFYTNIATLVFSYGLHEFSPLKYFIYNIISVAIRCTLIFFDEWDWLLKVFPVFFYLVIAPTNLIGNSFVFSKDFIIVWFVDLLFFMISSIDKISFIFFGSVSAPKTNYFFLSIISSLMIVIGGMFNQSHLKYRIVSESFRIYRYFILLNILFLNVLSFIWNKYYFDILSVVVSLFAVLIIYDLNTYLAKKISFFIVLNLLGKVLFSFIIFFIFERPLMPFTILVMCLLYGRIMLKYLSQVYVNFKQYLNFL